MFGLHNGRRLMRRVYILILGGLLVSLTYRVVFYENQGSIDGTHEIIPVENMRQSYKTHSRTQTVNVQHLELAGQSSQFTATEFVEKIEQSLQPVGMLKPDSETLSYVVETPLTDMSESSSTLDIPPSPVSTIFNDISMRDPILVVLLSYQRSGSTFLGELFNRNPTAFYQYEPLDALYSSLYGTQFGWNVPTDINTYRNGQKRSISSAELEAVSRFLYGMLTCDTDALPTESLIHPYQMRVMEEFHSTTDYIACIMHNVTNRCSRSFESYCGKQFGDMHERRIQDCHLLLKDYGNLRIAVPMGARRRFQLYSGCMSNLRETITDRCIHLLQKACQGRSLRAVKVVRASMRSMEALLQRLPNLRIIHLMRDPRGVALSRLRFHRSGRGLWTNDATMRNMPEMLVREATTYCRTVADDIRERLRLERSYPGRTLSLIYDDVVKNSTAAVDKIYEFLGLQADEAAYSSLNASITVEQFVDEPPDGTLTVTLESWISNKIKNLRGARIKGNSGGSGLKENRTTVKRVRVGSDIANFWQTMLRSQDSDKIRTVCSDFYSLTNYTWL